MGFVQENIIDPVVGGVEQAGEFIETTFLGGGERDAARRQEEAAREAQQIAGS